MKKILLALGLCLAVLSVGALEMTGVLPSGTKFFGKLDLKLLRESSVYQKMRQENTELFNFISASLALMSGITLDDIEAVYMAAQGEDDGFLVLEGKFDTQRIQQILSMHSNNQVVQEESAIFAIEVLDNKTGRMNLAVIIDEKTLAIGNPERVRDFLSAVSGKGELISPKKSKSLRKSYSEKFVLQFSLIELPWELREIPILNNIVAADIQADLRDGMDLKMKILTTDAEIAKASEQILNGLVLFLKRTDMAQFNDGDESAKLLKDELLQSFIVAASNDELLVTAHINESSLDTLIRMQIKKNIREQIPLPPREKEEEDVFGGAEDIGKEKR